MVRTLSAKLRRGYAQCRTRPQTIAPASAKKSRRNQARRFYNLRFTKPSVSQPLRVDGTAIQGADNRSGTAAAHSAPPLFAAASLLQSALLVGLTTLIAWEANSLATPIAELLLIVALATSGYVGYAILSDKGQATKDAWPVISNFAAPTPQRRAGDTARRNISDAEQIGLLRARVSHELRTPLNAVIGFSDMMHREVLGPVGHERYREYAAHIRKSAEHFQMATEKTLAVTELLASPPSRLRSSFNLGELVNESLSPYRDKNATTRRRWQVHIDEAVVVEGNRAAVQDALHHLWSCAVTLCGPSNRKDAQFEIDCQSVGVGYVDLSMTIRCQCAKPLSADNEQAIGAEFSLLLARLGIECGGGTMSIDTTPTGAWRATIRLPAVVQSEFQLH